MARGAGPSCSGGRHGAGAGAECLPGPAPCQHRHPAIATVHSFATAHSWGHMTSVAQRVMLVGVMLVLLVGTMPLDLSEQTDLRVHRAPDALSGAAQALTPVLTCTLTPTPSLTPTPTTTPTTKAPSLGVSSTDVPPGATITVTWANVPNPSLSNWIGLYMAGAPDGNYLAEYPTNGTASGSTPVAMPFQPGFYEFRLFVDKTSFVRLATSPGVAVGIPRSPTPTPIPCSLPTSTPTPTGTSTPSSTPTASPTADPNSVNCTPRPRVQVAATPSSGGLQVVLTANSNPGGQPNLLQSVRFTRLANASVRIGSNTNVTGMVAVSPPASTLTLFVSRVTAGASTVEMTVADTCGNWPTFVGGGARAF